MKNPSVYIDILSWIVAGLSEMESANRYTAEVLHEGV